MVIDSISLYSLSSILTLIIFRRFVTLFTSVLHIRVLLRVWDLFFCEGSVAIFRVALAMIKSHEQQLKELQNSADIFNALSDLPRQIHEVDELLDIAYSLAGSFNDVTLDSYRRRHLAYLMSDRGTLVGNPESAANLPKQHLSRYFCSSTSLDISYSNNLVTLGEK